MYLFPKTFKKKKKNHFQMRLAKCVYKQEHILPEISNSLYDIQKSSLPQHTMVSVS